MLYKELGVSSVALKFDDDKREFSGYASKFGGVDSYGDTIMPGAFADTLRDRQRPVRMRWNHFGPVIGRWLEMYEDETGLFVRGSLTPGHSVAEDVYASMKHKAVDGMSIGYYDRGSDDNEHGGKDLMRIELVEISPVEEPADLGATIAEVKSIDQAFEDAHRLKDIEAVLRNHFGFSKANAVALVSRVKAVVSGDPAAEKRGDPVAYTGGNYELFKSFVNATRIEP